MTAVSVALLGAGGQLGKTLVSDWQQPAGEHAPGTALNLHPFSHQELDVCEPEQLSERLSVIKPDVIINAAAYTQVDKAESEREQAVRINRDGAAAVASWAAAHNCRLIFVSTDFVFDGKSSKPNMPDDVTGPVNHYGYSKLLGEQAVLQAHSERSIIIRTSWLYSRYASNFVTTMLRLMSERDCLGVVADQIGTPTSTHSLVRLLANVVTADINKGIYHWSDAGAASWYDFAVAIQEEALTIGLLGNAIEIDPIRTIDYPTPAARPAFNILDKTSTYKDFAVTPIHWRTELKKVIVELRDAKET